MKKIFAFVFLALGFLIYSQSISGISEKFVEANNERSNSKKEKQLNSIQSGNWVALVDTSTGETGINGAVYAIASYGKSIFVGGTIQRAGGRNVNYIARWDGYTWSALGSGLNGTVYGIAVSGGNVYVVGSFTTAGGVSARGVAKWSVNTNSWYAVGDENFDNARCVAVEGNNIYIGGKFTNRNYIAKWNGSSWNSLSTGMNGYVYSIAVKDGLVYAGGSFSQAGGNSVSRIAKWDGSNWSALEGGSLGGTIYGIVPYGTNIFVCGDFVESWGGIANRVAKWDGTNWSKLSSGLNGVAYALSIAGTALYVGGIFTTAGGFSASKIAKWDGSSWSAVGSGTNNDVLSLGRTASILYVGGAFTTAGGITVNYIAQLGGVTNCVASVGNAISGGEGTVSFNDDDNTTAISINLEADAGSGQIDVYRYDDAPADLITSKDINLTQNIVGNVSNYRWIIESSSLASSFTGTIRFKVSDIPNSGINDPNTVTVYSRPTPGSGTFSALPTSYDSDSDEIIADITSFSEFAFGSEEDPLPVEITFFSGSLCNENTVELVWQTATEVNNFGFSIERSFDWMNDGLDDWSEIGFVQGHGTTNSPKEYSFTDDLTLNPNLNQVSYRLKQIDLDGTFAYSKVVTVDLTNITSVEDDIKYEFAVEQNYPNPFNPTTQIIYSIPYTSLVRLIIYDLLGCEVKTLVNEFQNAGRYSVDFNAVGLASGIYFYRLKSGQFSETRKLILLR